MQIGLNDYSYLCTRFSSLLCIEKMNWKTKNEVNIELQFGLRAIFTSLFRWKMFSFNELYITCC